MSTRGPTRDDLLPAISQLSDDDRLALLHALYDLLPQPARLRFQIAVARGPGLPPSIEAVVQEIVQLLDPDDAKPPTTH